MITVGLLVVLAIPTAAWFIVRLWPKRSDRETEAARPPGPKHRWWMP
jgi:hypothetical protein